MRAALVPFDQVGGSHSRPARIHALGDSLQSTSNDAARGSSYPDPRLSDPPAASSCRRLESSPTFRRRTHELLSLTIVSAAQLHCNVFNRVHEDLVTGQP